jgi:hypothetical protein
VSAPVAVDAVPSPAVGAVAESLPQPVAAGPSGSEPDAARRRRRRSGQGGRSAGETRAAGAPGPSDIIHAEDGREFWEAWVDSRAGATGAVASPATPAVAAEAAARPAEAPAAGSAEGASPSPSSERRPRRRGPRTEQSRPPAAGEARLYLNLGRRDNVDEAAIGQFLTERGLAALPMELHTSHTYLYASEAQVEGIVTALTGQTLATRAVVCERARR